MEQDRRNLGWGFSETPSYVLQYYTDEHAAQTCQTLIDDADVVIHGSAPYETLKNRLLKKKPIFIYSERLYKAKVGYYKLPVRAYRFYKKYGRHKNVRLLCASAYTAADFAKTRTFIGKAYKWGYFPEIKQHEDIDALIEKKQPATLLWVARFLPVKHPDVPVEIAKRLKADGYSFTLNMIGNGELEEQIRQRIAEENLSDSVHLLGSMKPEEVRTHMEESEIFLFTSDRGEGWGAVLNESMNSACAVCASHAIGAVPFLLDDGKNGIIYKDGNLDDLYGKVKWLMDHPTERKAISQRAYETMIGEWNAEAAARKFITLAEAVMRGEKAPFPFDSGVCSKAEIIPDGWYKNNGKIK
ncbi:MAG: glycosyltransferase family 4 protein [Clostridia bacterium]|nr:glycosyltransferase family 4 protein [Clostridia bacterium]